MAAREPDPPADARTDEELMVAYVAGDERAFRLLFDRYAPLLFRLVRRRLRSDDEARDIVQTTLLHMHRARNDFRHDSRLRPWVFTIALNLVREHYRRRGRRKERSLEVDGYSPAEPVVLPGTPLEDRERAERLHAALALLPDNQRTVIELHWFGESPYEEIARIVGASVGAVRVRAHRGYERLRKILPEGE
jgi:RNA polymerase sigma-70 factor (ECF subfamily)